MNKRIEAYVDELVANAKNESYILDIKEELLANLNEKYEDLINNGKSEDEAYILVISGIGDIDSLLKDIGGSPQYQPLEIEKNQQKRGILISIGIALYILSLIPIILFSGIRNSDLDVVLFIAFCAVATGFVAYGNSIGKSKYVKANNTFVEEYKEKVASDSNKTKLKHTITSSMWSFIAVFYLAISFITSWWHVTWIIFLIGAFVQQLILYVFSAPEHRRAYQNSMYWTLTLSLYFIISFAFNSWAWSWMIFLIAICVNQLIRLFVLFKKAA